jgi:hypothetical protein
MMRASRNWWGDIRGRKMLFFNKRKCILDRQTQKSLTINSASGIPLPSSTKTGEAPASPLGMRTIMVWTIHSRHSSLWPHATSPQPLIRSRWITTAHLFLMAITIRWVISPCRTYPDPPLRLHLQARTSRMKLRNCIQTLTTSGREWIYLTNPRVVIRGGARRQGLRFYRTIDI